MLHKKASIKTAWSTFRKTTSIHVARRETVAEKVGVDCGVGFHKYTFGCSLLGKSRDKFDAWEVYQAFAVEQMNETHQVMMVGWEHVEGFLRATRGSNHGYKNQPLTLFL